ncbi:Mak10 subunit, NatC N-terminal acetyltransferase-domain-containing protein [Multifurca ochricompacta]|uniref:Mak10 subunit, NatC N-terminal acetyltransferase-domain-containing protein n=1 Tax=Multifurca ochricompacta TaxID=376703 RepID=A0AAD4QPM1_9AGAM|nr:Mak10 subunit, NatC N-terminal acetyltransferase-domain-containing protein [Multifurca ochricompacta]
MSTELSAFWLPGGDDFLDVSDAFLDAAQDMEPGDIILTEDFTLYDAMSALEAMRTRSDPRLLLILIGDPRMDSGLILDDQAERPTFSPLAPLLPEEVCYILDRAVACEMEWHAGYTLSQTIYTCLYVHHLTDINPEASPCQENSQRDPARPLELITVVLSAAITGLLKCCDFAWRELNKGKLHDTEDWHSEKFEVSLMEGLPVTSVLSRLDDAKNWVRFLFPESSPWRRALLDRISLRIVRALLAAMLKSRLFSVSPLARESLQSIRSNLLPEPVPHSPATLAFDPHITRKLNSFMPLRAHCLPPQDLVWGALADLFDGWAEICQISSVTCLTTWKISGDLSASFSRPSRRPPFLRALAQSVSFANQRVLEVYQMSWLVDRFFVETIGIEYNALSAAADRADVSPLINIERKLSRMLLSNIQSAWFNPPRRRRFLAQSLLEWQELYHVTSIMAEKGSPAVSETHHLFIGAIPGAVLSWRLSVIREVLLSGFQLELYVKDEKPFVYWELSQVICEHLSTLAALDPVIPKGRLALGSAAILSLYRDSHTVLTTLLTQLTLPALHQPAERLALNFARRYKWAFRPQYARLRPQVVIPDLAAFVSASMDA